MAKHSVAGTGAENRAIGIRKWCEVGDRITLKREPNNEHDRNAIAVFIGGRALFGLINTEYQIGYIKAKAAEKMAKRLDNGEAYTATIESVYAEESRDWPDVTLDIKFIK